MTVTREAFVLPGLFLTVTLLTLHMLWLLLPFGRAQADRLLADVFALYLKTKNFHWHVSGPHFRDYHLLFDEQATEILAVTDGLAENVEDRPSQPGYVLLSDEQVDLLQDLIRANIDSADEFREAAENVRNDVWPACMRSTKPSPTGRKSASPEKTSLICSA